MTKNAGLKQMAAALLAPGVDGAPQPHAGRSTST